MTHLIKYWNKNKNKQMGPKKKNFFFYNEENYKQGEKTTLTMGESTSK